MTLLLENTRSFSFKVTQNVCHVAPSSHLTSLRAKGYDTHLYTPFTWLHEMRQYTSPHMKMIFIKFSVIIQVTRENQILYIYKQLSNEEPCLNTQNPHQNNQGILLET